MVGANPPPTKVSAGVTESVDEPENSSAAKTRETDEDDGWEDLSIDDLASLFLNFKTLDKVIYYRVLTKKLLKFGFSEKATKFEKIFVVLLTRASCSVRATNCCVFMGRIL